MNGSISSINKITTGIGGIFRRFRIKLMSREKYTRYLKSKGMHIGIGCDISKSIVVTEPWLVWIGDNVRLTRNVQLITHDGSLWTLRKLGYVGEDDVIYGKISIGKNTNIGWDVKVLPGVTIGENCIIGAGAVITKDVPDNSVVAGVPGRIVNTTEEYAKKIKTQEYIFPVLHMNDEEKKEYIRLNKPELLNPQNMED